MIKISVFNKYFCFSDSFIFLAEGTAFRGETRVVGKGRRGGGDINQQGLVAGM